ncbi:unnamed protein product [Pleuronectes platessa]|uniref:Uncharacterized protein n=1 Tax=Pleuronectes platessa TaxID=8262 RepID=A0A9N7VD47_PLEPL|nr:unnamed protein product [Pleuronectes platessa]
MHTRTQIHANADLRMNKKRVRCAGRLRDVKCPLGEGAESEGVLVGSWWGLVEAGGGRCTAPWLQVARWRFDREPLSCGP